MKGPTPLHNVNITYESYRIYVPPSRSKLNPNKIGKTFFAAFPLILSTDEKNLKVFF